MEWDHRTTLGFPSALGREHAPWPAGGPIQLQKSLAVIDHGREGWLQAGTWLQIQLSPGLMVSSDPPSLSLAMSELWTYWVCEDLGEQRWQSVGSEV